MEKRRMLYSGFIAVTLALGIAIGTIVSDKVTATEEAAAQLSIPEPVQLSNVFARIATEVGPAVVNIDVETTRETGVEQIPDAFRDFFDFFGDRTPEPDEGRPVASLGSSPPFWGPSSTPSPSSFRASGWSTPLAPSPSTASPTPRPPPTRSCGWPPPWCSRMEPRYEPPRRHRRLD